MNLMTQKNSVHPQVGRRVLGSGDSVTRGLLIAMLMGVIFLTGCKKPLVEKDYARPLPPGAAALRKLDPSEWPSLTLALRGGDASLIAALDNSSSWFAKASSKQFFPMENITHDQAQASVLALREILTSSTNLGQFNQRFAENFDIYTSVGWNGEGEVLFTGYYSPVVHASRTQTPEFRYPLYNRPADLVSDPITGAVQGKRASGPAGGPITTYPTRAQIEDNSLLRGGELVWLNDKLDSYIVQVQGSAKLLMTDGTEMLIGYAGNNGHAYTSIGKLLVSDGKLSRNTLSLPAIRAHFKQNPQELDQYTRRNDRFVFFKAYDKNTWPAGSLGVEVIAMRSLATDKSVFPRGLPLLVVTQIPGSTYGNALAGGANDSRPFEQFMADQDTGGAILAPGRADIYMGTGQQAEHIAGQQLYEGRLYYLILKPQRVSQWAKPVAPTGAQGTPHTVAPPTVVPAQTPQSNDAY